VTKVVARAVAEAAERDGVARKQRPKPGDAAAT
jgi:hypothetical protein